MEKIKTIYYNEENDIMFQEYNFVSEAPVIGDWMYWHTLNWEVENRNFNFDLKQLEIFCKQL